MRGLYIVWRDYQRRAETIAPLLDASAVYLPNLFHPKWARPLDYLWKAWRTLRLFVVRRPAYAVIQAPPVYAALPALLSRIPYAIDAHNATFQSFWVRVPLTSWILRHARVVITHNDEIEELARHLHPRAKIRTVADPVPLLSGTNEASERDRRRILFICSFASDEPVDVIIGTIEAAPQWRFVITADPRRLAKEQREGLLALPNVELTGRLPVEAYQHLLRTVGAAIVLTNRQATQPSGACEALSANTPLIVSRTSLTSRLFGSWATVVDNDSKALVQALESIPDAPVDWTDERTEWNNSVQVALGRVLEDLDQPDSASGRKWTGPG
ncbi:MAG: glycosyltransferase [Thioalkalivibrio sp.]|nr:glycosyltransferase [Thioalkalivibrio sp.]